MVLLAGPAFGSSPIMIDVNRTMRPVSSMEGAPQGTFFTIGSTTYFQYQWTLCWTDGTEAGTRIYATDLQQGFPIGMAVEGKLFFSGLSSRSGFQPWVSDGTNAGTHLIADIAADMGSSPRFLGAISNIAYLSAQTKTTGRELYRSDGSAPGTYLVQDINSGPGSSDPTAVGVLGSILVFSANDGTSSHLYATDGTAAGMHIIADFAAPPGVKAGSAIVFPLGKDLWSTNGTAAGTTKILAGSMPLSVNERWVRGTTAFFVASDGAHSQLWTTDGTAAGTAMVSDFAPAPPAQMSELTLAGDDFFFFTGSGTPMQLWKTSVTTGTTVLVKDGLSSAATPIAFNGILYFANADAELWKSDGTPGGTAAMSAVRAILDPGGVRQDSFVFVGCDASHGCEPWISDGTGPGTHLLINISPEVPASSNPANLAALGNKLIFTADDGSGKSLLTSDGTQAGTLRIAPVAEIPQDGGAVVSGNLFYYVQPNVGAYDLWRSDGTVLGTFPILTLPTGGMPDTGSSIRGLLPFRGGVFFAGFAAANGFEPWWSDGTSVGTSMIEDVWPGPESSFAQTGGPAVAGGFVYFPAVTGSTKSVWRTDGTSAGTSRIVDMADHIQLGSSTPQTFTNVSGTVYFAVTWSASQTFDLWRTDGSAAGTAMVKRFSGYSPPDAMFDVNQRALFFATEQDTQTPRLWRSDGSEAGTEMLTTPFGVNPPFCAASAVVRPTELYWISPWARSYFELWRTDATSSGTSLLKTFQVNWGATPYATLCSIHQTVYSAGALYFTGTCNTDPLSCSSIGANPWIDDHGSMHLLWKPLGAPSTNPASFVRVGSKIFFSAEPNLPPIQRELWVGDIPAAPPGDINDDGSTNAADIFYLINHLFVGGPAPINSADVNGDQQLNAADIFYLINYLFAGGPPPL